MPGLTLSQLTNLTRSTRAKQRKVKFVETLKYNRYAGLEEFIYAGSSEGVTGTQYEERIRLRSNTGATRGVNLYQVTASQKAPPVSTLTVPYIAKENKGIVFDLREQKLNTGDDVQIINHLNAERSANYEDIANHLETDIFNPINSSSDNLSFWGLPMWLRPSMTSGGSFTADLTGGFNGTYIRYGDTSVSATLAGIDASSVDNERWRNWVGTRAGSTVTKDLAIMIRRAMEATNFRPLQMLKGEQVQGDCVIFMSQTDHESYKTLVSDGPDDRNGDLFPFSEYKINGARISRAPILDNDALASIYGVRLKMWKLLKVPGFWMNESDPLRKDGAHNVFEIPIDIMGNLMTNNPRACGFRIHGSF
jgi:hypothetical protein